MKKMLLVLLTVGVIFSCGKKEEPKADDAATETQTETTAEPAKEDAAATEGATFKDAEVQKYVDDYKAYIKEVSEAVAANDATKIADLGTKAQEWATKSQEITTKLANDPEEAKKFGEELTRLSQEYADEMAKMAK